MSYQQPDAATLQGIMDMSANYLADFTGHVVTNNILTPVFSSATVRNLAPNVVEVKFSESVSASTMSPEGFMVKMIGTPTSVTIASGDTCLLNLPAAVVHTQVLSIAYTGPNLQDASGFQVAPFSELLVNSVATPTLLSATISNGLPLDIVLVFSALTVATAPSTEDFTVVVAGSVVAIASVDVPGTTQCTLTLHAAVSEAQAVSVGYTEPDAAARRLRDTTGAEVQTFDPVPAINNIDSTSPFIVAAHVYNANPLAIWLRLSEPALVASALEPSDFAVSDRSVLAVEFRNSCSAAEHRDCASMGLSAGPGICHATTGCTSAACAPGESVSAIPQPHQYGALWKCCGNAYAANIAAIAGNTIMVNWDDGDSAFRAVASDRVFRNGSSCASLEGNPLPSLPILACSLPPMPRPLAIVSSWTNFLPRAPSCCDWHTLP